MDYNEIFRQKTKQLALDIIRNSSELKYTDELGVIRKQIIRSSTSTAANYRALGRARSQKERYAKLSIVVEEADETLFWLEIIEELKFLDLAIVKDLKIKAEEVLKSTASYRKKMSIK